MRDEHADSMALPGPALLQQEGLRPSYLRSVGRRRLVRKFLDEKFLVCSGLGIIALNLTRHPGWPHNGTHFGGTGLISKRPEDIRAKTHSAPLAHFAECAVLGGISE